MNNPAADSRSLLFVPGNRPERFDKARGSGADVVILDLEDAVPPEKKRAALDNVLRWVQADNPAVVRVNAVGTATHEQEIAALAGCRVAVMLPKAESTAQVEDVHNRLGQQHALIPLIETPLGVRDAGEIAAAPGVIRLALGTIDLAAALGVAPTSHAAFVWSRGALVVASAAAGLPGPIDGVTTQLDDEAVLDDDIDVARTVGFSGKLCVHPRQVQAVNRAFLPSDVDVEWARRVVEAAAVAPGGVTVLDGAMIDAPVVTLAQRLLRRHERFSPADGR
ncbi:HpcH/HpaI aldolase/citrate lyase family protein [Actinophytocola sp.]|uniref:HpcH/HpaI aldolase/citrate lyase family protein n=1 Tax=Actinophytocola sp. TaxID=1872138 RepID=UPI003D6A78AF